MTTLLLISLTLILTAAAHAKTPAVQTRISETIVEVWRCADQRGIPRTLPSADPYKAKGAYAHWLLHRWQQRKQACLQALHAHDAIIRRLRQGLAGTPMAGSERSLEAAARRRRISPYLIAAIAGTESSFGAASCSGNPYNAYGLSSCTTGWHVPTFPSWAASYAFMASFLTDRWPHARTTYDFHGYAACSSCWGERTAYHMRSRFGVDNSVRYPA